jgi:hypothetical protein
MGEIIAERRFQSPEGKPVTARIYRPEKPDGSSEWSCRIEVLGQDVAFDEPVIGVDSFQALYLALRCLCVHLDKTADELLFPDGEARDPGIPLIMPWPLAPSLKVQVYRLIQEKIEAELNAGR